MGERRAVAQILNHLRESAAEGDAIEADALAKTTIVEKKRKAFKKDRDTSLGVVVQRKLALRKAQSHIRPIDPAPISLNFEADEVFDTPYDPALHKRSILWKFRSHRVNPKWGPHKKTSQKYRSRYYREFATRWKEATLRDAPLLAGFFAEEPQWRERILRWCEVALAAETG